MTSEYLLRAIGDLGDDIIILPISQDSHKPMRWTKWIAVAACVILTASSLLITNLLHNIQPKPIDETLVDDPTETNEQGNEPSDKSEYPDMQVIRNYVEEYRPDDYGEPMEIISFDTASDSFHVYGGELLPEVLLKQTAPDEGAALIERVTDVVRYYDSKNKLDIFRAEYLYSGKESGTFTVTAENTSCSNIGSQDYEPNFFSNNDRLIADSDSISIIASNTAFVAETNDYVFAQMIVLSPNYSKRINESEQEVKEGVFVSYDEVPEEYILLTFRFEKEISDEQIVSVLDRCWVYINNAYLS